MLRNCKVARVLPRIADTAKNDRSAVLRARYRKLLYHHYRYEFWSYSIFYIHDIRCCEYALLTLEYWADAPEIQRSADLYEDLIKCCVADAMSEVGDSFIVVCLCWMRVLYMFYLTLKAWSLSIINICHVHVQYE